MILGRTGFARKGEWTASAVYDMLDIVTHEGKEYIGKRNSIGSEPSSESSDWVMLPGAPSFEIEETASGYDLTITGSDGTLETISILNGEVDREELEDALEAFRSSTDAYLAPDYDDTATYSAGDSCIYDGRLYRCIEDIPTAEPWTTEHWEPVVLSNKAAQMRKDAVVKADVVVSSAEPGDVVSFDDGADNVPVRELVVVIEPVQSGSGDPSPDNIRPISGWTGVEVTQAGKNVVSKVVNCYFYADAVHPVMDYQSESVVFYAIKGTPYVRSSSPAPTRSSIALADSSEITSSTNLSNAHTMNPEGKTTWVAEWTGWTVWYFYPSHSASVEETAQVEVGSTATSYEPYQGTTIPIDWTSTAGTVYGGSLDVTTGVLTVDTAKIVLDGTQSGISTNWRANEDSVGWLYPYSLTPGIKQPYANADPVEVISDRLKTLTYQYIYAGAEDVGISAVANSGGTPVWGLCCRMNDPTLTTAAAVNAWLAQNPVTVVYKLTQPITYQLSPALIRSLFGVNTFWSNSNGGIQSLRYVSDLKLYLEQLTKPTEDDMVANSNIPANIYFTIGNALYLSTAAIAVGEKIEPDTNCTRKSLADALNDLQD